MSKKAKVLWGVVVVILILAVIGGASKLTGRDKKVSYVPEYNQTEDETPKAIDQVLKPYADEVVMNSDMIGTWLTNLDGQISGLVLKSDGTAGAINNTKSQYLKWRIDGYKLILTVLDLEIQNSEIAEKSFIIDYVGINKLVLREGENTVEYSLEAKN